MLQQHVCSYSLFRRLPCLAIKNEAEPQPTKLHAVGKHGGDFCSHSEVCILTLRQRLPRGSIRPSQPVHDRKRARRLESWMMHHTFISLYIWCAALRFCSSLHHFSCVETRADASLYMSVCVCVCFQTGEIRFQCLQALIFAGEPRPTARSLLYKFEKGKS